MPALLAHAVSVLTALHGRQARRDQRALRDENQGLRQQLVACREELADMTAARLAGDARLLLALEATGLSSWDLDPRSERLSHHGQVPANTTDEVSHGSTREVFLANAVHPDDHARVVEALESLAQGRVSSVRVVYRLPDPAGAPVWMETHGTVLRRDPGTGRPVLLGGVTLNVTERHRADPTLQEAEAWTARERALEDAKRRASDARLRAVLDAVQFGTWEYDIRTDQGSRGGHLLKIVTNLPASGFGMADWLEAIHAEDRDAVAQTLSDVLANRADRMLSEFRVRRADGGWAIVESTGAVADRDPITGAPLTIAGVSRDVTETRLAAERQTLLAREVDHRAKNALAVVQAALRLTPKTDAASYARAVEGRVRALARAHTLLAETQWHGAPLRVLAAAELAAFLPMGTEEPLAGTARVVLDGPDVLLAPVAAQGISMTLHELATNATKHGALSDTGGQVVLSWAIDGAAAALHLHWTERNGPPITSTPQRRGFGSRLVESTVRDQLRGTVTRDWEPAGLVCRITLPLVLAVGGAETVAPSRRAAE